MGRGAMVFALHSHGLNGFNGNYTGLYFAIAHPTSTSADGTINTLERRIYPASKLPVY